MTKSANPHFFSVDLPAGNWRWWFGLVVVATFTLSMVFLNAKHHVSLGIILLVTMALSLAVKPRGIRTQDFGFQLPKPIKVLLWTLLGFAVFTGLTYWFEHSNPAAKEASKQVIESLSFGENYRRDLLLILTVGVFAPLNEELIYRAVLFRGIWNSLLKQQRIGFGSERTKKLISFAIAAGVSSYFFMTAHGGEGQDTQIYMIFLLGVMACGLYALTGSLLAPILVHSLNNTFALWQSLDAGHMTFASQAGKMSLNAVMFASPLLTLVISLCIWLVIHQVSRLTTK